MVMKLFAILILLLFIVACAEEIQPTPQAPPGQVKSDSPRTVDVIIENFAFNEPVVKIKVGDTVRWTNKDTVVHTATGDDFDTGNLKKGESKEITFSKAGSYDYSCTPHPNMKGKIIVSES